MPMTSTTQPVRTSSATLTEIVFDRIRAALLSKSLAPGARVRESALIDLLNVSKSPVREALLRLRHIGPGKSTDSRLSVLRPSVKATRDAYEYRTGLERSSAGLPARRESAATAREIAKRARLRLVRAPAHDVNYFRDADRRFHLRIAQASATSSLAQAIDDCVVLIGAVPITDLDSASVSVECGTDHRLTAGAIGAANPISTDDAMHAHIQQ
jgi:DNA-binding GntR family transcriptional regulator